MNTTVAATEVVMWIPVDKPVTFPKPNFANVTDVLFLISLPKLYQFYIRNKK